MNARGLLFSLSAVVGYAALGSACAQAQDRFDFNVPPQTLSEALTAFGGQGHINIIFSPETVVGKRSKGLKGKYAVSDALQLMLRDTGLEYANTRGGSYLIQPSVQPITTTGRNIDTIIVTPPEDDAEPPRTVIVRGYRLSLEQAQKAKKAFSGIAEVIVAEDIAKFPDNNVAEAIQRASGTAIARDQGEGRSISVRGLGPDFTRVEINGVEGQAATDGLTQGVNRGRGFDFNVFPSELFRRIDVKKTASADQPEGSLGATVSMVTPHPFDRNGLKVAASMQVNYNDLSERAGTRAAFLISNTFDEDRIGLLFSLSYAYTPLEIQGVNSGAWNQGTANGGFCKPTTGTGGICDVPADDLAASLAAYDMANQPTTYNPQFYRYTDLTGSVKRLGVTGSFQWRPSTDTLLTADLLFSQFKTQRLDHFIEAIGFSRGTSQGGKPEIVPRHIEVDENGTIVYGVFDNVDVRSEVIVDDFKTDFLQGSFNVRHRLTDNLSVEGLIGFSSSRFDNFKELSAQIDRFNVDGYSFDIRKGGQQHPDIQYGFDVTDPANWYFGPRVTQPGGVGPTGPEIRLRPNFLRNDFKIAQGKLSYAFSDADTLDIGFQVKRYDFEQVTYRFELGEADFPAPAVSLASLTQSFCGEDKIAPPAGTPRCWLEPNIEAFIKAYDLFGNTGRTALSTTNPAARGFNQSVSEDNSAFFAQLHFRRNVFGLPMRGDIGVRNVRTSQTSSFYESLNPVGYQLAHYTRSYTDLLPSLNLAFDIGKTSLVRFSAARVMARPPLSTLSAATSVTVSGGRRQVSTGNAALEPFRATNYDLSYEWYPSADKVVSIGLFYKDISTYIQSVTYIAPYSSTGLPVSLLANTSVAATDDFSISNVVNTPGGPLTGLEVNYQQPFRFLPGLLSGFGVNLNYTYVVSHIEYNTTSALGAKIVKADILNLSRNSYNATLYYERGRLQWRLSTNYRDRYLTSVPGSFNTDASGVDGAQYWDCSLTYKIRAGFVVTFEGHNLTNAKNVTWDNSSTRLLVDARLSGRQYSLGVRYTF